MKHTKSLAIAAVMMGAMALLGGCGSDKVGYVDTIKLQQQSQKMQDVNKDVAAKKQELEQRLAAVDPNDAQNYQKAQQDAQREWDTYTDSKDQEIQKYFEDEIGKVAEKEGVTVVLTRNAVASGGEDLTDKVLDQVGRADTSATTTTDAATTTNAQESQQ